MARPRQFSDEDILVAARRCFIEQGPGVSTSVIAKQIGLSQAALFKRFSTKEELMVRACAPPAIPAWIREIGDGPDAQRPIAPQLAQMAHHLIAFFQQLMPGLMVLKASGVSLHDMLADYDVPPPVLGHRALRDWFDAAIAQGQLVDCDTETAAFVFLGALHSRSMLAHVLGNALPPFDPEPFVDSLVEMLLDGIALERG